MPTYRLTYFNLPGKAETIRMLFKLADQEFEDVRIDREQWKELKPNTPMGQVPILEIDGVTVCQSNAIARYLARQFGYSGKTPLEELQVDMIVDSIEDCTLAIRRYIHGKEGSDLEEAKLKFKDEILIPVITKLENLLAKNNDGSGFLVGDELTWADLTLFNKFSNVNKMLGEEFWENAPKLKALADRVKSNEKIAAWLEARPTASH